MALGCRLKLKCSYFGKIYLPNYIQYLLGCCFNGKDDVIWQWSQEQDDILTKAFWILVPTQNLTNFKKNVIIQPIASTKRLQINIFWQIGFGGWLSSWIKWMKTNNIYLCCINDVIYVLINERLEYFWRMCFNNKCALCWYF